MVRIGSALLGLVAATTLAWSCVQSDNLDNDEGSVKAQNNKDAGTNKRDAKAPTGDDDDDGDDDTAPGDDDSDDDTAPGDDDTGDDDTGDDDTAPGDDDTGDDDTGDDDTGDDDTAPDASTGPAKDATTPTPKPDAGGGGGADPAAKIAGSATKAKCSSYGKMSGNMCAGYFCGVAEADIAAALESKPSTVCPEATGESVCSGELTTYVGQCARSEKTNLANAGLTDEQLRPKVQECVYKKDEALRKSAPPACISCFLDAAQCASSNCLIDCLAGDSAGCDACRQKNNCNAPVMKCAGLPSPF